MKLCNALVARAGDVNLAGRASMMLCQRVVAVQEAK
jgi:hypothetical protein